MKVGEKMFRIFLKKGANPKEHKVSQKLWCQSESQVVMPC